MAATYTKRSLLTGLGMLYLQKMTTEDTPSKAPAYDTAVLQTPSLDKAQCEMEMAEKKVYLSNLLHDDISAVKSVKITLDAAYLPAGFEEDVTGMTKLGEGVYAMPTNPVTKFFRMAFPITTLNGDEIILNFPKCTLKPVQISSETERDDVNEQIRQFEITGQPLIYRGTDGKLEPAVYYKADLTTPEAKAAHDRNKLLEGGFYDATTLAAAKAATGV